MVQNYSVYYLTDFRLDSYYKYIKQLPSIKYGYANAMKTGIIELNLKNRIYQKILIINIKY